MPPKKIEYYDLGEWILDKLYKEGLSSRAIAERLLLEKGVSISHMTIEVFKRATIKNAKEFALGGKEEYRQKMAEVYLDTLENLVDSLIEIKSKLEQYRDTPNWQAHSKYAELSLKHLYMVLKRAKEIGPDVQMIKNTMNIVNTKEAIQDRIMALIGHLVENGVGLDKFPQEYQELYKRMKGIYA